MNCFWVGENTNNNNFGGEFPENLKNEKKLYLTILPESDPPGDGIY